MKLHQEELKFARAYVASVPLESLSREQMKAIMDRGRALFRWSKEHPNLHCAINIAVFAFLLGGDFLILTRLPRLFLEPGQLHSVGQVAAAAVVCGSLHSFFLYSLSIFSMHEGAAHRAIFPPRGPILRVMNAVANNLCRIAASEPRYYSEHHMTHHNKFGTEDDGEFLNFVLPKRYWLSLIPLAAFINYTDFIAHRPMGYTKSRIVSAVSGISYHLMYGWYIGRLYGALFPVLAFFLFLPHVGFFLDRLRQFSEHNLMPLENKDGSRSFGWGLWGMLIGGGPWGSPCHWEHHLVASLPWYQQLVLHRHVVKLLTPAQRKQYLLEPVIGYPKLVARLLREPNSFIRSLAPSELGRKAG